jgi:hypothetical protein
MVELKDSVEQNEPPASRLQQIFARSFDPAILVKFATGFLGLKQLVRSLIAEINAYQAAVDRLAPKQIELGKAAAEAVAADTASPEQRRDYQQLRSRQGIEVAAKLAQETAARNIPTRVLTTEEIERFDDFFRSLGKGRGTPILQYATGLDPIEQANIADRMRGFDWAIDSSEMAARLRFIEQLIERDRPGFYRLHGYGALEGDAPKQQETLRVLHAMLDNLEQLNRKDGGLTGTSE